MTKAKMKFIFSFILCFSIFNPLRESRASETAFEYPELSVVPRASERLESEAAKEREHNLSTQVPFLVSASATFLAGLTMLANGTKYDQDATKTSARYAPYVGMGVGAIWWGISAGVLNRLDTYSDASLEVGKMSKQSQRDQLARERRAEEAIYRAGGIARRAKWISIATNLGTSMYMIGSAKSSQLAGVMAGAAALMAFTPLVFTHRWEETEHLHRDYKKRIYAPIAGVSLLPNPNSNSFSPGLVLAFQF